MSRDHLKCLNAKMINCAVIILFLLFFGLGCGGGSGGGKESPIENPDGGGGGNSSTIDDPVISANHPMNGSWVLVNFLGDDDNGTWDSDDSEGIGMTATVSGSTWVEKNDDDECEVTYSISVDTSLRYSRQYTHVSSSCDFSLADIGMISETGRLEFSKNNTIMIDYFDVDSGDTLIAFKWMKQNDNTTAWYKDGDGDGYSDGTSQNSESRPFDTYYQSSELTATSGDCNDSSVDISPSAIEICGDDIDQDCNGFDSVCAKTWYKDTDGDGYGDLNESVSSVTQPDGYEDDGTDCDDTNANINPNAPEICDQKDNNCDQQIDENQICFDCTGDSCIEHGIITKFEYLVWKRKVDGVCCDNDYQKNEHLKFGSADIMVGLANSTNAYFYTMNDIIFGNITTVEDRSYDTVETVQCMQNVLDIEQHNFDENAQPSVIMLGVDQGIALFRQGDSYGGIRLLGIEQEKIGDWYHEYISVEYWVGAPNVQDFSSAIDDDPNCSSGQTDTDDDGIIDSLDICPDTPSGEAVDLNGCSSSQIDTDGDGIMNSFDTCPNTPVGETVNTNGCSDSQINNGNGNELINNWLAEYSDGDCKVVQRFRFADNGTFSFYASETCQSSDDYVCYIEGTWNVQDHYLHITPTASSDPLDDPVGVEKVAFYFITESSELVVIDEDRLYDRDGVGSGVAGLWSQENNGEDCSTQLALTETEWTLDVSCSTLDYQRGGVYTAIGLDRIIITDTGVPAPNNTREVFYKLSDDTLAFSMYGTVFSMQPLADTDNDGVSDNQDQCQNTPGSDLVTANSVDNNGCSDSQKDSDNDGVSDAVDACPDTATGTVVDITGCANSSPDSWLVVSSNGSHTVAIKTDGTLYAWGNNSSRQLGGGASTGEVSPVQIGLDNDWLTVSAGGFHTAAVKTDGSLYAWGSNRNGQLGDGTTTSGFAPGRIGAENNWVSVAASGTYTVALKSNGTLYSWGSNSHGQLGDGTFESKNTPTPVGSDNNWVSVSTGGSFTVALKSDGTIYAWGSNTYGQLGNGTTDPQNEPIQVGTDDNWASISAGSFHTVALKTDGSVYAWGQNWLGQLGLGTWGGSEETPVRIGSDNNWASIIALSLHTVGIKTNGSLYAWGDNHNCQLGNGTTESQNVPTRIGTDSNWSTMATGSSHTVVLKTDGTLYAWGQNNYGQVGDGTKGKKDEPTRIGSDSNWEVVSAGGYHTVAVKTDGTLYAWGENGMGQLGTGDILGVAGGSKEIPTRIGSNNNWFFVSTGEYYSTGIRTDGTLYVWGLNNSTPTQVGTDNNWASVSSGYAHIVAVNNGMLYAWGANGRGQLGNGSFDHEYSPIRIGSDNNWLSVSAGEEHTVAIKTDGSLYVWGANDSGQLGDNTNDDKNVPTIIGSDTQWASVSAGDYHTVAIKTDGSLYAWGANGSGQLGDGTYIDKNSPTRIGSDNDWALVTAGDYRNTAAIKTDGTLYTWGRGYTTPNQLGADSDWLSVTIGGSHTVAVKTDGSLYAWGDNSEGQIGDGTAWREMPVVIH